jgi:hypothetical protein
MPWLSLNYTTFTIPPTPPFPLGRTVQRPFLAVTLTPANGKSFTCMACVDSGADDCVFPLAFAFALGLNPLFMKRQNTGGVGNTANLTFYENITLNFGTGPFSCYVGFTAGLDAAGIGLLGQLGFLDRFNVILNRKSGVFQIEY